MKKLIIAVLAAAGITGSAQAQHALHTTLWNVANFTNNPAATTNLNASVDTQRHISFDLEVVMGLTNASTGTIGIGYDMSNNGTTWGNANTFTIPLTGAGTVATWRTNIATATCRYWRLTWVTNSASQHITNASVKAYIKRQNNPSNQ